MIIACYQVSDILGGVLSGVATIERSGAHMCTLIASRQRELQHMRGQARQGAAMKKKRQKNNKSLIFRESFRVQLLTTEKTCKATEVWEGEKKSRLTSTNGSQTVQETELEERMFFSSFVR